MAPGQSHRLSARTEALRRLDEEMQTLALRRNTFTPISSLPPEILSIIFLLAYANAEDTEINRTRVLFDITHVCHYWRIVALGYPRLWCNPPTTKPECTSEFLRRSKNDLNVYLYMTRNLFRHSTWRQSFEPEESKRRMEAIYLILGEMARIAALSLSLKEKDLVKLSLLDFTKPAPLLESLEMDAVGPIMDRISLFDGQTPRLRSAILYKFDFVRHGDSSLLKNLRDLELWHPVNRPTKAQMLDILRGMPSLETLKLVNASASYAQDRVVFPAQNTICLDHLQRVELVDDLVNCVQTMASISPKNRPALRLKAPHYDPNIHGRPDDTKLCLLVIHSFLNGQNAMPLLSARLQWIDSGPHLIVDAWTTVDNDGCMPSSSPQVSLNLRLVSDYSDWYRHLPLAHVRAIELLSPEKMRTNPIEGLRLYGAEIQTARVRGHITEHFIVALAAHLSPVPNPELRPLFATLKMVSLDGVKFWRSLSDEYGTPLPILLRLLLLFVEDRYSRGTAIAELRIINSWCQNRSVMDQLRASVEKVFWNV